MEAKQRYYTIMRTQDRKVRCQTLPYYKNDNNQDMEEKLMQIQRGECSEDWISPQDAQMLMKRQGIRLPDDSITSSRRNINNDEWNRNLLDDFKNFDIVKRCIFFCLADYRVENEMSDDAGKFYQKLMKFPYNTMFDFDHVKMVRNTLIKWNMNTRGAQLADEKDFIESVQTTKKVLDELNQYILPDFLNYNKQKEIEILLCKVYEKLNLSKSNPFVTTSKTLHFYMPQLFIPIDRTYTVNYFTNYKGVDLPDKKNKKDLVKWAMSFHRQLAKLYDLHIEEFNNLSIQTKIPITKLLDDMLIGFTMYRRCYCLKFDPHKHII